MKINGSLVFDASSASEIQNLRLEKFAGLPVAPAVGDNGRLIYNSTTGVIFVAVAGAWVAIATGGDATALLAEVDRIEAAAGLNSDGSFNAAAYAGTLADSTSIVNVFEKVQALLSAASAATAAEAVTARAAELVLRDDLAAEVVRAGLAEGVLTTAVADEAIAARAAELVLRNDLVSEAGLARAAELVLRNDLASEVGRATGIEGGLRTDLGTETADRIAADGAEVIARNAAILVETDRALAAEGLLGGRVTTEFDRAVAAEGVLTLAISDEVTRAGLAEAALASDFSAKLAGLTWKNSVKAIATNDVSFTQSSQTIDGVMVNIGDRVLVNGQAMQSQNGIYVVGSPTWNRATDMDESTPINEFNSAAVFVEQGTIYGDTGWTQVSNVTTVGGDSVSFTQFNGAAGIDAGAGLTKTGNTINVGEGEGITVTADTIAVSTAYTLARQEEVAAEATAARAAELVLRDDLAAEVSRAGLAEVALGGRVDDEAAARLAADLALGVRVDDEATARSDADAAEVVARDAAILVETDARVAADAAEVVARDLAIAAEATLRANADTAEFDRATAVEAAITTRISSMYHLYTGSLASSHVVTHNIGALYCNVTVLVGNEVVIPQSVTFDSANQLTVTFNTAVEAKVVVMGLASA